VASPAQKAKLAESFDAQAVDMEASAVAMAARAHGIRFAATKVISDELHFEMPAMARFIDANGRFRTARFALFVSLRPWLWRRVARLASNSSKAQKALGTHLERFRQQLGQPSGGIATPSAAVRPTPQPAATGGLNAGGRK